MSEEFRPLADPNSMIYTKDDMMQKICRGVQNLTTENILLCEGLNSFVMNEDWFLQENAEVKF